VSTTSSHWGVVLKDNYPWNHLDEVNQVLGLIGSGAPDAVAFYDALANRLKSSGL
jgi:triacylglycerol lipase